jgi:uncharacterized protein (DUF1697 family)
MARIVVLLRGINVGSHKRIKMADLRALLEERGYEDVKTYLQSGNVVLSSRKQPATVQRDVEKGISSTLGHEVDVVARTAAQLAATVKADPFADVRDDDRFHQVVFLAGTPDLSKLEAADFAPEQLVIRDGELHAWCPDGTQNSPLIKALEKVRTTATARNWRTVVALNELANP